MISLHESIDIATLKHCSAYMKAMLRHLAKGPQRGRTMHNRRHVLCHLLSHSITKKVRPDVESRRTLMGYVLED